MEGWFYLHLIDGAGQHILARVASDRLLAIGVSDAATEAMLVPPIDPALGVVELDAMLKDMLAEGVIIHPLTYRSCTAGSPPIDKVAWRLALRGEDDTE